MTTDFSSTKPETLTGFIGKHFIYTYDNGWRYEMYVRNAKTIDYRIHHGMVSGRWVKGQEAHIVRLADGVYKVSWGRADGNDSKRRREFARTSAARSHLRSEVDRRRSEEDCLLPERAS